MWCARACLTLLHREARAAGTAAGVSASELPAIRKAYREAEQTLHRLRWQYAACQPPPALALAALPPPSQQPPSVLAAAARAALDACKMQDDRGLKRLSPGCRVAECCRVARLPGQAVRLLPGCVLAARLLTTRLI